MCKLFGVTLKAKLNLLCFLKAREMQSLLTRTIWRRRPFI